MANKARAKTDVLQGTLDLMVLQTLATLGPVHGYTLASPPGTGVRLARFSSTWGLSTPG